MSANAYLDACGWLPTSGGTGTWTVATAIPGYQTLAAAATAQGVASGAILSYRAESADKSQWEEGFGASGSSNTTLARSTITANSSGGTTAINFSSAPNVFITAASADLQNASLLTSGTLPAARITFAAKSDQTTGTSNTLPIAPLHQQDHDSAAKAWVMFTGSAVNGAQTVNASYNVSGVSRTAAGQYTVTFTTAFASASYVCIISANNTVNNYGGYPTTLAAGSVAVQFITISPVALADPANGAYVAFFGRQ